MKAIQPKRTDSTAVRMAEAIIRAAVKRIPDEPDPLCANALAIAMITDRTKIPPATLEKLRPVVGKYFKKD